MSDSSQEAIPGSDEGKYCFEDRGAFESVFGVNFDENLRNAEKCFSVSFVVRDTTLKIISDSLQKTERAAAFIKELIKIQKLNGRPLDGDDFERILKAFIGTRENELQDYFVERIKVSPRKKEIIPRSYNQLSYIRNIRSKDIVFGIGPAGTGKTYLAMAMAVSFLLEGKYDRIILTRPAVEAGENLGFLPGKLEEKINPYLRPLYDALYDMLDFTEAEALIERNIIEVAPLAFMRGRTLNNAFVILDEAQNTLNEQMLMFLTRLGSNSQCVICGDPSQTDLPERKPSGLSLALKKLRSIPEISICAFNSKDVVRHPLVEKIVEAYANNKENEQLGNQPQENDDED